MSDSSADSTCRRRRAASLDSPKDSSAPKIRCLGPGESLEVLVSPTCSELPDSFSAYRDDEGILAQNEDPQESQSTDEGFNSPTLKSESRPASQYSSTDSLTSELTEMVNAMEVSQGFVAGRINPVAQSLDGKWNDGEWQSHSDWMRMISIDNERTLGQRQGSMYTAMNRNAPAGLGETDNCLTENDPMKQGLIQASSSVSEGTVASKFCHSDRSLFKSIEVVSKRSESPLPEPSKLDATEEDVEKNEGEEDVN